MATQSEGKRVEGNGSQLDIGYQKNNTTQNQIKPNLLVAMGRGGASLPDRQREVICVLVLLGDGSGGDGAREFVA